MSGLRTYGAIVFACAGTLWGCDRAHMAHVRVGTDFLKSSIAVNTDTPDGLIKSTVETFSRDIQFTCREPATSGAIIECGPAWHRQIVLRKDNRNYEVSYLEAHPGWGKSQDFCRIQSEMFMFFSHRFGRENIEMETNDACGRANYP
jgi:hypothetical protein